MATTTPAFTAETARRFERYSEANAAAIREALPCECEPYRDVFTYRRWQAQGMQVQKGERSLRLPLLYSRKERDEQTGEERETRRRGTPSVRQT